MRFATKVWYSFAIHGITKSRANKATRNARFPTRTRIAAPRPIPVPGRQTLRIRPSPKRPVGMKIITIMMTMNAATSCIAVWR